jgi:hypothetical protein
MRDRIRVRVVDDNRQARWIEGQQADNRGAIEGTVAGNKRALRTAAGEEAAGEEGQIEWAIDKFLIRPVDPIRAPSAVPLAGRAETQPAPAASAALPA